MHGFSPTIAPGLFAFAGAFGVFIFVVEEEFAGGGAICPTVGNEDGAIHLGMKFAQFEDVGVKLVRVVEAIARRELLLGRNNDWTDTRIRALQQAIRSLTDTGQMDEARIIAKLLSERSEFPMPLRHENERFLETPMAPWRVEIEQYIHRQMPFQLTYQDAADRLLTFTIRFACTTFREKRQYLECWCDETDGNRDLPALQHNWTLRLDRIPDAAISTTRRQWRDGLDKLEVEMHLFDGLAFAYRPRPEDQIVTWLEDSPQTRRVVRRITNTFWFFRELLPHGKSCVLVSPPEVRQRFKAEVRSLYELYQD